MRISVISDWNAHRSLADNRSTKITTRYYIRSKIEINQITPKLMRSKKLK